VVQRPPQQLERGVQRRPRDARQQHGHRQRQPLQQQQQRRERLPPRALGAQRGGWHLHHNRWSKAPLVKSATGKFRGRLSRGARWCLMQGIEVVERALGAERGAKPTIPHGTSAMYARGAAPPAPRRAARNAASTAASRPAAPLARAPRAASRAAAHSGHSTAARGAV